MATDTLRPEPQDEPLVGPSLTFGSISSKISSIVLGVTPKGWLFGFAVAFLFLQVLMASLAWLLYKGVGIWGVNQPVGWAFAIINFVWWIGIGHAGTLISAILLLLHQTWRNSINRLAEAMTLFAVACAGLFPLAHMGRPWWFFWMLPYPTTMGLWPQFRSPLIWDVFAVSTYFTVSLVFWYIGLIPDFATLRDRAKNRAVRVIYGMLAMGWRGSAMHWHRYETAYLVLAGLSTPLVLSVHSIVSFDFAISIIPGWHTTIFPPYFVAGAIYAGFAMVLTLFIPIRVAYGLKDYVTDRHMDLMAKVMLATGLMVAYGYLMEAFMAYYSAEVFERDLMMKNRVFGPYGIFYWMLILCNIAVPQLLWLRWARRNMIALFTIAMFVNVGMWLERFVILMSLQRDFMPSSWGQYAPTIWDTFTFLGTLGLFFSLIFLFLRVIPMISMTEMRVLLPDAKTAHTNGEAH